MNLFKPKNKEEIKDIFLQVKRNMRGSISWEPMGILRILSSTSSYAITINKKRDRIKRVLIDDNLKVGGAVVTNQIKHPIGGEKYFIVRDQIFYMDDIMFFDDKLVKESLEDVLKPIGSDEVKDLILSKGIKLDKFLGSLKDTLLKKDILRVVEVIGPSSDMMLFYNETPIDVVYDFMQFDATFNVASMEGYPGEWVIDKFNKVAVHYGDGGEDTYLVNIKRYE